jgi:hypothetical protein
MRSYEPAALQAPEFGEAVVEAASREGLGFSMKQLNAIPSSSLIYIVAYARWVTAFVVCEVNRLRSMSTKPCELPAGSECCSSCLIWCTIVNDLQWGPGQPKRVSLKRSLGGFCKSDLELKHQIIE